MNSLEANIRDNSTKGQLNAIRSGGKVPAIIYGGKENVLDFTYIEDLVSGVKSILENKESKNQIFNITFGEGRKIIDLICR